MRMRTFENVAKLIKSKRQGHPQRYSQSELSSMLGYKNGQFISNVERGLCNIPLKMLGKVCDILDISSQELKKVIMLDHDKTLDNYLAKWDKDSASEDSAKTGASSVQMANSGSIHNS